MRLKTEVFIDGYPVPQHRVDEWERRRIAVVAGTLGAPLDSGNADLDALSRQLAAHKQALGYDAMLSRLGARLKLSAGSARLMDALSFGRRRVSATDVVVEGMSAGETVQGIEALMLEPTEEHEIVNLGACPDHYALRPLGSGRLEVIETTGGSPFPIQFFIEYGSEVGLTVPRDTTYPYQSAGVARLGNGIVIGGVRHQFRDEGSGFRARLAVEFPLIAPGYFIRQHQLHLACEFTRWFRWLHARKRGDSVP